jgi:hypothetical protein
MPVLIAQLQVIERQGPYKGFPPFQGVVAKIGISDPTTNTTLPDVVDVNTWVVVPKPGP